MRRGRHIRMSQNTGNRRNVNTVFDRPRGERMPDRMELNMFQPQLVQQPCKIMLQIVRIDHAAGLAENDEVIFSRHVELLCETAFLLP